MAVVGRRGPVVGGDAAEALGGRGDASGAGRVAAGTDRSVEELIGGTGKAGECRGQVVVRLAGAADNGTGAGHAPRGTIVAGGGIEVLVRGVT